MLTKLRRRFILIIMGLVGLVLLVVLAASAITNYQATAGSIRNALDRAVSRGPESEQLPWVGGQNTNPLLGLLPEILGFLQDAVTSDHAQGERFIPVYVVVLKSSDLTVLGDNSAFIAIDGSLAREAISTVTERLSHQGLTVGESRTGLLLNLRLFYRVELPGDGSMTIALADASELLNDTFSQIGISALIWLGAMLAFFLISLLLARIVTRPVAEAWERQRRFVADASHELKTPLTVILANNSLLAAHPHKTIAEQEQWLTSTQAEAQRMDGLVRDLLLLAQADESDQRTKSQVAALPAVDLSALLSRSLLQFEAVFFERGINLTTQIAPNVTLHGDAEQLERLIQILIDNASKYAKTPTPAKDTHAEKNGEPTPQDSPKTPDASPVASVHVSLQGGAGVGAHALLAVTNTGEPIPPGALPHLFERFFRADASHSEAEGSGLGLSLAQAIAVAHHGSITVRSTAAAGTTFTVTL